MRVFRAVHKSPCRVSYITSSEAMKTSPVLTTPTSSLVGLAKLDEFGAQMIIDDGERISRTEGD